jgi:multidrug resistance efflux pump
MLVSLPDRKSLDETSKSGQTSAEFPAAIAAFEAKADMRRAKLAEAQNKLQRSRRLFSEGILSRSDLETASAEVSTLESDWAEARQQLQTALVDHARRLGTVETDMKISSSSAKVSRAQSANVEAQLKATRLVSASLREQLAILERKREQFSLFAPLSGTVLGEDVPRMAGQYFLKGAEICRIVDTRELLAIIQVPERHIGDIRIGASVRVKPRAFPDKVFHGVVSRIGNQSELDENRQVTYRVELSVRNDRDLLRPGMTIFARIDFGRYPAVWILAHKLRQALKPEVWML